MNILAKDVFVAAIMLLFIGGIAWISIHSNRNKDDDKGE